MGGTFRPLKQYKGGFTMTVTFYNNYSKNNVVNKVIDNYVQYDEIVFKEPCSIIAPHIILSYRADVATKNYCYIPDLNRYYYITDVTLLEGQRLEATLVCDVLMSFKELILNSTQTVIRAEETGRTYINDTSYPILPQTKTEIIRMDSDLLNVNQLTENSINYIINVAGGILNESE